MADQPVYPNTEPKCGNCRFGSRDSSRYPLVECKRHAPVASMIGVMEMRVYPWVHSVDVCGDWEGRYDYKSRFGMNEVG